MTTAELDNETTTSSRRLIRSMLPEDQLARLPRVVTWGTLALCVLPALLSLAGVDFSTDSQAPEGAGPVDINFYKLSGAFTHTLLEWSAVCVAIFTVCLAFARFFVKPDTVTPVIALALLAAGSMDAFHTLAADRLINAEADNRDLIPFTWAMCRLFNSLICAFGVSFFLFTRKENWGKNGLRIVLASGLLFLTCAYAIIVVSASAEHLPQTQFPDHVITRPWDVGPFVIFLITSFLFVGLYRKFPTVFTYSLVLSTVPNLATQAHMALGSSHLFDAHFNIAHFLKIVAYAVPCAGLLVDYVRIHQEETALVSRLQISRDRLETSNDDLLAVRDRLERSNADLQQFAYIASHDLKAPLRGIGSLLDWVEEDLEEKDFNSVETHLDRMRVRIRRMEGLIEGILKYSRLEQTHTSLAEVHVSELLENIRETVLPPDGKFQMHVDGSVPPLFTNEVLLSQVLSNLVSNAVKHHDRDRGEIRISCRAMGSRVEFTVADDGPGIEAAYHEKIFEIFQTLQARDTKESTGIGLSLVRKLVLNNGGEVSVESDGHRGTTFRFTWQGLTEKQMGAA